MIIMGTGAHAPWVSRLLEGRQHRGLVASARWRASAAPITTARKLAVTLLALWKTGPEYQPLPLAQAA